MPDNFTEITSESWFGRILNSFKGMIVGLILIAVSVFLLSWNENRAVSTAKSLKEGSAAVVSAEPETINPANEKKLVHVSGAVTTKLTIRDPLFAVSANAIRLRRKAEMYQWVETEKSETQKKLDGGSETVKTYSYEKKWMDHPVDSSKFKQSEEHKNPGMMAVPGDSVVSSQVTMGGYKLGANLIAKMKGDEPLPLAEADVEKLSPNWKAKVKLDSGAFYVGQAPSAPVVGDERVTFTVLNPGDFSILARQTGNTFDPYPTHAGREIERVESGIVGADLMFQHAATETAILTWGLRFVGFLLMAFGIGLILNPIAVFADVIPFLGDLLGAGVGLTALLLAFAGSLITIAVAWLVVRPVLGGGLLVAAVAWLFFGKRCFGRKAIPS
jgi:hypothetical protein